MSSRTSTVAGGAAIIAVGTLTSRLLGLIRENMLVNTFPSRWMTDAYISAFLVPDVVYYLLAGGALSAAFIPVFSGYLAKGGQKDADRTGSSIANLMLLCVIIGVILILIFAPEVVRLVARGYAPGTPKFNLTVILAREMCVMVVFTALSGLITGMLNSYHHFLAPTVVWNTYNLGIIVGIGFFSKIHLPGKLPAFLHWQGETLGIHGAALGVLLGAVSLAAVQLPILLRYGFRYSPIIDLKHPGVREVIRLFAPVTVGLALGQFNLLAVPKMIGSALADGTVTDINTATRFILLPFGLFAVAVSTAAFPRLAQQVALGEKQEFREMIGRVAKVIMLLAIPSAVALCILAEPVVAVLYGGKGYRLADIYAAAFALALFCFGLVGLSIAQLVSRAFYSLHDTLTPVLLGVSMVGANIPLALLLARHTSLDYGGIALSTSVTSIISTLVLFEILRRRLGGVGGRAILSAFLRICLASAAMGVAVYVVALLLAPTTTAGAESVTFAPTLPFRWPTPSLYAPIFDGAVPQVTHAVRLHLLAGILVSGVAGLAVYLGALWALRVQEVALITERILGRFGKRPTAA